MVPAALVAGLGMILSACTLPNNQPASGLPEASVSTPPVSTTPPDSSPPPASPSTATLTVASLPVHNGEVGIGYLAVTLHAAGGTPPYAWALSAGALPAGLALSSAGMISGKGTRAGTFNFAVRVTDSGGAGAGAKTSIKMYAALSVGSRCANVCKVGIQCTACGAFGSLTGGLGPYRYTLSAGAIPTGMTLNALALSGPFPNSRTTSWSIGVQVTDQFGASKSVTAKWLIFKPIAYVGTNPYAGCYSGPSPASCFDNTDLKYTLGSPSDKVTVKVVKACYDDANATYLCTTDPKQFPTYLPPNWAASAKGGVVTVSMACGTSCTVFYGDVFIVLVDHGACVAPSHVQSVLQADVNIDV